jgi:hypothetical protein
MVRYCLLVFVLLLSFSVFAHAHAPKKSDFEVKLECDLSKAVDDGKYDWVHKYVKKGKAPKAQCKLKKKIGIDLFKFSESPITTDEVIKKMAEHGCRPTTWPEHFALGAQHPELQRKETVVGLGSQWTHEDGTKTAPTLEGDRSERLLKLYPSWMGWENDKYTHYVFAAVCDKKEKKK